MWAPRDLWWTTTGMGWPKTQSTTERAALWASLPNRRLLAGAMAPPMCATKSRVMRKAPAALRGASRP
eukprot:11157895-Lingulodinium_polyedra.AAC.1